jgi:hypothetical protein
LEKQSWKSEQQEKRDGWIVDSLPSRYVLFLVGKNSRCLFLVAVEAVDGSDSAEEAVLLAVDAGGEE